MSSRLIFRQLFDYDTWTYTYLLADPESREAAYIDTVKERHERDLGLLKELGLNLKYLIETHIHADHITGADALRKVTAAKVALSEHAHVSCADIALKDGQELKLGDHSIRCMVTPGHTNTCMSFYADGMLFTGDTLFIRDVGRTDFQHGSNEAMYKSIHEKFFTLPDETFVYPGHDYQGKTVSTVKEEKEFNQKIGGGKSLSEFSALMAAMKLAPPKKIHFAVPANLTCGRDMPVAP